VALASNSMKYLRRCLLRAIGLTIAFLPATANTTGSITGLLKDDKGAPVAGGKVTLVDKSTGKTRVIAANRKGSYTFLAVLPGTYTLHAEAPGFTSQDQPSVVVHVDSFLKLDLTLDAEKTPQ
jgi:hypothetical protein